MRSRSSAPRSTTSARGARSSARRSGWSRSARSSVFSRAWKRVDCWCELPGHPPSPAAPQRPASLARSRNAARPRGLRLPALRGAREPGEPGSARARPVRGRGSGRGNSRAPAARCPLRPPVRHPRREGRRGIGRLERGRGRPRGTARVARGRSRACPHDRRLSLRVHVSRPLWDARGRGGRQRLDARAARPDRRQSRGGRRRRRLPERHDGRAGRRDPLRARRDRLRPDADRLLRGQVRLGVLRPLPRGRRVGAGVRRPAWLPDGPCQRPRSAARVRARRARGSRCATGQAGASEPRRDPGGARALRPPGRRVQRLRRIRDAEGGGRARLARRAAGGGRVPDGDRARGRRPRRLLLDEGARGLVVTVDLWETIAQEAAAESPLWAQALRPEAERDQEPVFSPLAEERYALGLETIYEGYLLHYGRPRLFSPHDDDTALLLGDYLYAHGLVRVAETGTVQAVAELAALISRCAQLRADALPGDGEAWAETAAKLGEGRKPDSVGTALAAHRRRVG